METLVQHIKNNAAGPLFVDVSVCDMIIWEGKQ
jgi:hypothetical protein